MPRAAFVADSGYDGSDHPSSKPGETFLRHFDRESDGRFACPPGREHDAVTNVSWYHAAAFCRWLSEQTGAVVRLPTDREWERAAGGTERRTYPWGDEWDATMNYQFAAAVLEQIQIFHGGFGRLHCGLAAFNLMAIDLR